nr:retrovirus-related Pol polyprotein from transposon TNT 1-94 [Tanacetum cinerariifolium]
MVYGKKDTDSSKIKTNDDSFSHSNDFVLFDFSDRSSEPSTNDLQTCDSSVECSRPNKSDHNFNDSISSIFAPASESRDTIVIDCDKQKDFPSVCTRRIETDVKSSKTLCNKFGSFNKESYFRKHKFVASKSCYVCGSYLHLIKDCDLHEQRFAKRNAEGKGILGRRPTRKPVNLNRPTPVSTGQQKPVSAGHQNPVFAVSAGEATLACNSIPLSVSTGDGILGPRPLNIQPKSTYLHSFTHNNQQIIFPITHNSLYSLYMTGGLNRKTAIKPSAGWPWTKYGMLKTKGSKINGGSKSKSWSYAKGPLGRPKSEMTWAKDRGIVDSGCSRSMSGNKDELEDFEDFAGGEVTFGRSTGKISRKDTIKTKTLNFKNVLYVKELQHFNLISVSQICDQTHRTEAVATACYVLNRVLVTKPYDKTPYELLTGDKHSISYLKPFSCHVTILNTINPLGKFDKKSDECYIIGYSIYSKAYRVYNLVSRKIEETVNLKFLENKPFVAGTGQAWMFDIDYLTGSLNYSRVISTYLTAGSQGATSSNAGSQKDDSDSDDELDPKSNFECWSTPIGSFVSAGSTPPVSDGSTPLMSPCASPISTDRHSISVGKCHVSTGRPTGSAGRPVSASKPTGSAGRLVSAGRPSGSAARTSVLASRIPGKLTSNTSSE